MMDVKDIQKLLAHRYPFLLVDRVTEIDVGRKLVAYKNVTINEEFFNGHFPGHPVMPGVLQLEALAQACALLAYKSTGLNPDDLIIYLMSIDNAKFRKPVVPGDTVEYHVRKVRRRTNIWRYAAEARVAGVKVAEAEVSAMLVDG